MADGEISTAPDDHMQDGAAGSAAPVPRVDPSSSLVCTLLQAGLPQSAVVAAHGNFDSESAILCSQHILKCLGLQDINMLR